MLRPAQKRQHAEYLKLAYDISSGRACRTVLLQRSVYYYKPIKSSQTPLRSRIKELAAARVRYGYQRIYILLRREGWKVNHKRVYRLYCEEGLHLRSKRPKRRISAAHRANRPEATRVNESWSMDFVSDNLFNGHRIRSLTVVGNTSK
jgi:putative transposase